MTTEIASGVLLLLAALALAWLIGLLVTRLARWPQDAFSRVLLGTTLLSLAGLLLAELGKFSLSRMVWVVPAAAIVVGVILRAIGSRHQGEKPLRGSWLCGLIACIAALTYLPPFQTFIAGSDSTMYLSAGVHLAHTGSVKVQDRISRQLSVFQRNLNFPSVGLLRRGPYIRLAGGLLKRKRDDPQAAPAFFPLAPVWVALFSSSGGAAAGPLVAPLFESLMVWAVCLFALEVGGIIAALATGLFLLTNFAVWWYGRFLVSEPLAGYFVWAGLVMLARWQRTGAAGGWTLVLAGAALGLAGFARTEIIPFTIAAAALVMAWRPWAEGPRYRWLAGVLAWIPLGAAVVLHVAMNPSHHQAYFATDMAFARLRLGAFLPLKSLGRVLGVLAAAVSASGLLALWMSRKAALYWLRSLAVLGTGGGIVLYVALGGDFSVGRGAVWLLRYLGLPLLVLSGLGMALFLRGRVSLPPLAVALWLVASLTFLLNPHVALKHPWAIRRFLPELIPGLAVLAGLAVALLAGLKIKRLPGAALAAAVALSAALFQVQPIRAMWEIPLYQGVLVKLDELDRQLEPGANVVVESMLADWQVQVPLWLVYGHETIMARAGGQYWRGIHYALTKPAAKEPLYWLTFGREGYLRPPKVFGLSFKMVADLPLAVGLPRQSMDRPPSGAMILRTYLKLYKVKRWRPRSRRRRPGG